MSAHVARQRTMLGPQEIRMHMLASCGKPGAEVRLVPAMEMSSTGYGCFFTPGGGVVSMSLSACRDTTRQFPLSQRMT